MMQLPPPGYVPPKHVKKRRALGAPFTFGEAFRTTAKVASGYSKVATLEGYAAIAQEVRKLIRG
jgi:hypothetical protein